MNELPDLPLFAFFKPSLTNEDALDTVVVASWVFDVYMFS